MIDKIYIQYKKNVDKGINPMDFLMSLDNRIVMSVEFENDFIRTENLYNDLYKILDGMYQKDKKC